MDPEGKKPGKVRRKQAGIGDNSAKESYLDGQLLIAMPVMGDPRFERSVIYMCAHSSEGAMGIMVNRPAGSIDFPELLSAAQHHQEGRPDQAAGKRRDHEGLERRSGRYRPRLRAAFQRLLPRQRHAADRRQDLPDRHRRHPQGDRQRHRTATRHPRARLCRLGTGSARKRDPGQWLAALRRRSRAGVRRRRRRQVRACACARSASIPACCRTTRGMRSSILRCCRHS